MTARYFSPNRCRFAVLLSCVSWTIGCQPDAAQRSSAPSSSAHEANMQLTQEAFGSTADGEPVTLYTCINQHGCVLKLMDYGAIVVAVEVPDRDGQLANVTLGFPSLAGYQQRHPYFGATVGRYCNRIGGGQFTLEGHTYQLATNDGANHLHGGERGFDRYLWNAETISTDSAVGVKFTRLSPDGEEGYPGNVQATAIYTLNNDNELKMEFSATTDAPCPVNLTNHCYWNLAGSGTILNHELMIQADQFLAVDDGLIPTGQMPPVRGTPLDFTRLTKIGARIDQVPGDPGGYDHCFVLRSQDGSLALAARVQEPTSGRVMEILTTQPGIQFYSGNFLDGAAVNGGFPQHAGALPRSAALSGLAQPPRLPQCPAASRRDPAPGDHPPLQRAVVGVQRSGIDGTAERQGGKFSCASATPAQSDRRPTDSRSSNGSITRLPRSPPSIARLTNVPK